MNRKLFLLILTAALFSISGLETSAQKMQNGGRPKPATRIGGLPVEASSSCVKFAPDVQVCKRKAGDDEDGDGKIFIRRGGRQIGEINGSVNAFGGATDGFQAFYGDLDNNRSKELVIVDFEGQGQGLGVKTYTINIFPDFEKSKSSVPLTFSDSEFGADGSLIYDAKKNETLFLLTDWGDIQIKDPKRGDGLYFSGRFLRYKNGKLTPAAEKPILARRYLNSFERMRFRTEKNPRAPYLWLQSADTLKLKTDPAFDINFAASESGTIERIETASESSGEGDARKDVKIEQLIVRLDSGERAIIVLSKSPAYVELPSDAGKIFPSNFGFLPQKTLLPGSLYLLDALDKVEKRRVRINTEKAGAEGLPNYYVWFVDQ